MITEGFGEVVDLSDQSSIKVEAYSLTHAGIYPTGVVDINDWLTLRNNLMTEQGFSRAAGDQNHDLAHLILPIVPFDHRDLSEHILSLDYANPNSIENLHSFVWRLFGLYEVARDYENKSIVNSSFFKTGFLDEPMKYPVLMRLLIQKLDNISTCKEPWGNKYRSALGKPINRSVNLDWINDQILESSKIKSFIQELYIRFQYARVVSHPNLIESQKLIGLMKYFEGLSAKYGFMKRGDSFYQLSNESNHQGLIKEAQANISKPLSEFSTEYREVFKTAKVLNTRVMFINGYSKEEIMVLNGINENFFKEYTEGYVRLDAKFDDILGSIAAILMDNKTLIVGQLRELNKAEHNSHHLS